MATTSEVDHLEAAHASIFGRAGEEPWLTVDQTAQLLNVSRGHVLPLARRHDVPLARAGRTWRLERDAILDLVAERHRWISESQAAQLTGLHRETIGKAARAGHITRRPTTNRSVPGLDRASVVDWAAARAAELAARLAARPPAAVEARPETGPPADGHHWLDTTAAAALLGLTPRWVTHLALQEKLPATRGGGRWWVRREHIENVAAARAFTRRLRAGVAGSVPKSEPDLPSG